MNFLAHAYLSFDDPEILLGNMISDFVKGNQKLNYPLKIQKGIMLHRFIDEYTDKHTATINAKQFFKAELGLYSGAFIDVVYDYFLANDFNEFNSDFALENFAVSCYYNLEKNSNYFPASFQLPFQSMKTHNWLVNYKNDVGIQKSFDSLTNRAKYINHKHNAFAIFLENKENLKIQYDIFFKDIKQFALQKIILLHNNKIL